MTIGELRTAAREWQARLGLHEWTLIICWGKTPVDAAAPDPSQKELAIDCDGNAYWTPEHPNAIILLRRKQKAHLHTLVHEMLHVRIEGHQPHPKKYDVMYERSINAITAALLGEPEP